MRYPERIPKLGSRLIRFFVGTDYAEVILGDLDELFTSKKHPYFWFWGQFFQSLPGLFLLQFRSVPKGTWMSQSRTIAASFILLCGWELFIARQISWPIAKEILNVSPLSAGNTCRLVYVFLYGFFVFVLMFANSFVAKKTNKTLHFHSWQVLLFAGMASLPALFLIVFPLPTDGALWFRILQIVFIWIIAMAAFSYRKAYIACED